MAGGAERRGLLTVLSAATLTAMLPNSILIPGFPAIARGLGVPYGRVGLLITAYTLAYAAAVPFVGVLADRVGRKRVLVPALILFTAGGVVPLATRDAALVLGGRALMGVGGAGVLTVVFALLGDLYTGPGRERATGAISATIAAADAAVPFVGGLLAALHWRAPFAVYLLALPAAAAVVLVVPDARPREALTLRAYARAVRAAVGRPLLAAVYAAVFLLTFVYFGVLTILPAVVEARWGGGSVMAGTLILAFGVAWAASAQAWRRVPRRWRRWGLVAALGVQGVAVAAFVAIHGLIAAVVTLTVWGTGMGAAFTGLVAAMNAVAPADARGAVASIFNALTLVGLGAGPFWFARVASAPPFGRAAVDGAILLGAAALLFAWGSANGRGAQNA